jgi:hypothetical protein
MSETLPESNDELLELNCNRVIVLGDRGRSYRLTCRRITNEDWLRYFSGIVVTSQQDGKERVNVIDVNTPRLALAEAVLEGAEGYKVAGGVELTSLPHWKDRLPLSHRTQLGEILADVRSSEDDYELEIHPEGEEVLLDATWSAVPSDAERFFVLRYRGLKHILKTPTEAQYRRYSAEASRSRVVGGSRNGKTVYMGAQPLLAKLYDELVIAVDGYCFDGVQLAADKPKIIREMDMLHKVMAAQELFQPQNTASLVDQNTEQGND